MIPTKIQMLNALQTRCGKQVADKLQNSAVAICGLGGLGSNVATALVRAGVGRLVLIDFDKVDVTNLNRQQYKACQVGIDKTVALFDNLKEVSPYAQLQAHTLRIDETNAYDLLKDVDVVCEAFDDPRAKAMLADFVLTQMPDKFLVSASGMSGFLSANSIKTKKITDKFFVCGDVTSDVNDDVGLVSSRVMLCASHQAHVILQILTDKLDLD